MADSHTALLPFDAVLFDLDGVLTATAKIHAACWKSMFDDFLRKHADSTQQPFTPFDIERDYEAYVDGKPRYDGVASFLESRDIKLPYGNPTDDPHRFRGRHLDGRRLRPGRTTRLRGPYLFRSDRDRQGPAFQAHCARMSARGRYTRGCGDLSARTGGGLHVLAPRRRDRLEEQGVPALRAMTLNASSVCCLWNQ
jgi:hypothetical protein